MRANHDHPLMWVIGTLKRMTKPMAVRSKVLQSTTDLLEGPFSEKRSAILVDASFAVLCEFAENLSTSYVSLLVRNKSRLRPRRPIVVEAEPKTEAATETEAATDTEATPETEAGSERDRGRACAKEAAE